ncbi:hypothetical protein JRO89_XS13G0064100 [Xanthoceras sorbifolium]|uniref:PHD-type domain-containing protein n=1 Tax=Xanthoceras sorbifolium TaxID=99658 RepID=A0ABQ8H6X9_9ROSI|nr:hypothetical protein JRO89_XS13G0064100 [Xanthoceras sorbifolium]
MAYKMMPRNQRVNYDVRADFSASGDESHDSTQSDPNYTRYRSRRRSQARANIDVNTSGAAADQMQQHGDGADASSSRKVVTERTSARRPWNREDEVAHRRFFDVEDLRTCAGAGAAEWSDESDDACMICADGGDLICCDTCPSTFHYSCMGVQNIPKEDWHCYYCLCKYCLIPSGTVESCMQCEKKYHSKCQEERNIFILRNENSFCDTTCANIYNGLKNMVGVRNELDDGLSWSLLQQMQVMELVSEAEKHRIMETKCIIGVAWTVMDECFESNIDRHTGIDVLQRVIYNCGSNLMRINFIRFFTTVLEKVDNIISVATLRVYGSKIAEIPFIVTRPEYRRQGMLRKLFTAVESVSSFTSFSTLCSLRVENISIKDELMNKLVEHNTLTFLTVVRLQKSLVARPTEAKPYYEEANGAAKNPFRVLTKVNDDNNPSRPVHMEVNGADNNRNENNLNPNYNSRKILPFDLNLEPPDDDDDNVVYN